jgi:hypothetical protein
VARAEPGDLESLSFAGGDPEDYGKREVGSAVLRRVNFRNLKHVPVQIEILSKSCGCLSSEFDKGVIAPGEQCTLSMGTSVTPSAGQQVHFVSFRTTWEEAGEVRQEQGICYLRFRPNVAFIVRPEIAALAGATGSEVRLDMSILSLEELDVVSALPPPRVELPGWHVSPIQPISAQVVRYRVWGRIGDPGICDTMVTWQAPDSLPAASMALRVFSYPACRVFPGGAVFVGQRFKGNSALELRVFQDPNGPRIAGVRVTPDEACLDVRLLSNDRVQVVLEAMESLPARGHASGELVTLDGTIVRSFPIVWWLDESDPR